MKIGHALIIFIFTALIQGQTIAQNAETKPCQGPDESRWTKCIGSQNYPNGDKYVGEFKSGKPDGQGTYTHINGATYIGTYREGKRNGLAEYTYENGEKYIGEFKNGKRDGESVFFKLNGIIWLCDWVENKVNGRFIEYGADKTIKRSGIYQDGKLISSQYLDPNSFARGQTYKAAEEKRIQDVKAAEEKRIQEAKEAEEKQIQEAKVAEENRVKEAKAAEERRIWLTTPAGKKFTAAEEAKAKKEEAERQKEEAKAKKEEAERQKILAVEEAKDIKRRGDEEKARQKDLQEKAEAGKAIKGNCIASIKGKYESKTQDKYGNSSGTEIVDFQHIQVINPGGHPYGNNYSYLYIGVQRDFKNNALSSVTPLTFDCVVNNELKIIGVEKRYK